MSYTRYDYLVDRHAELFKELQNLKAYPEHDKTGKLLTDYSKEIDAVEVEISKIEATHDEFVAPCAFLNENQDMTALNI